MFDTFHIYPEGYDGPKTTKSRVEPHDGARGLHKVILGSVVALAVSAAAFFGLGGSLNFGGDAEAHNGVIHTLDNYGATFTDAQDCAKRHGNRLPNLYPTGRTGDGQTIYLVDRTPTLREGLEQVDCWVVMYRLFNAIAADKENIPGHWNDLVSKHEADAKGIAAELAKIMAREKYELTNSINYNPFGVYGYNQAGSYNEAVMGGSDREAQLGRMGFLNLGDLSLIGR